jgi:hypothetical protein
MMVWSFVSQPGGKGTFEAKVPWSGRMTFSHFPPHRLEDLLDGGPSLDSLYS